MAGKQSDTMVVVQLNQIRNNEIALRAVDTESLAFQEMVASIRRLGIINPISVRYFKSETEEYYELVDGLQRKTAAESAGLTEIPCHVVDYDDDKVLEAQIIANCHGITQHPREITEQLKRILLRNPMMTESDLAKRVGKSYAWIQGRLNLMKLEDSIMTQVDKGAVCLSNAYSLAKLPTDEQADWVERAATLPPNDFIPQCDARLKQLRQARREGRTAVNEFIPVVHLRKLPVIREELESQEAANQLVADLGVESPIDAFTLGIKWCVNMDQKSIQEQKAEFDNAKDVREKAKALRAVKRVAEKKAKLEAKAGKVAKEVAEARGKLTPEEQARLDKELAAPKPKPALKVVKK